MRPLFGSSGEGLTDPCYATVQKNIISRLEKKEAEKRGHSDPTWPCNRIEWVIDNNYQTTKRNMNFSEKFVENNYNAKKY